MEAMKLFALGAMVMGAGVLRGAEAPAAKVASPDGRNEIRLWLKPLSYSVSRDGVEIVSRSKIGLKVDGHTLGLGGTPDTFFAVARQSHDGAWYAAAIGDASAQDVTVDTKFLGVGEWKAEVFRDAADSATAPTHYVHETKTVKAGDKMAIRLAPGGGFAVKFVK